jgi:hypothetical protein
MPWRLSEKYAEARFVAIFAQPLKKEKFAIQGRDFRRAPGRLRAEGQAA